MHRQALNPRLDVRSTLVPVPYPPQSQVATCAKELTTELPDTWAETDEQHAFVELGSVRRK